MPNDLLQMVRLLLEFGQMTLFEAVYWAMLGSLGMLSVLAAYTLGGFLFQWAMVQLEKNYCGKCIYFNPKSKDPLRPCTVYTPPKGLPTLRTCAYFKDKRRFLKPCSEKSSGGN